MLVPLRKAIELTGLSANTLRKYADEGRFKSKRVGTGNQRLYDREDLLSIGSIGVSSEKSSVVCYCRVSSRKQHDDLVRQVANMRQQFPSAEIIQDIGSGLNFKREGLKAILERCLQGDKFTLIISYRDRLCRFGFELIEFLMQSNGGEIMVLNKPETSPESELTEDLLAILHVFSCRMHGLRWYVSKIKEDKDLSNERTKDTV
jgi:predicted site-specific integrase-resolvase